MSEKHALYWRAGFHCLCGEEWPNVGALNGSKPDGPLWHIAFGDWYVDDDGHWSPPQEEIDLMNARFGFINQAATTTKEDK